MNAQAYADNLSLMVDGPPVSAQLPAAGEITGPREITNGQNRRMIAARFDAQFTTDENRAHWALADGMSVDASASWMVRRVLRNRCRYEYHNNPYMQAGANRLAQIVIGTGPRLHMASDNKQANDFIEKEFNDWCKKINLAEKLRTSRAARFYNGEGFLIMRNNPEIDHEVKLDLFEVESDQVTSPMFGMYPSSYPDQYFDGVILDPWGNPSQYHVLRQHPGAFGAFVIMGYEFDVREARYVIHDYKRIRPGQQRGIPDAVPAIDLFAEIRRLRKAVLGAADTAANHAGLIQTQAGADVTSQPADTGFGSEADYIQLRRNMMAVLPAGWTAMQMKAEQPTTTYDMFTMSLLTEASQTLDLPLFVFVGDARLANMASAYVVVQSMVKSVQIDRSKYEFHVDRLLKEWRAEAALVPGYLPHDLPSVWKHAWRWDRISNHADPAKMANAQTSRLDNGTSSIPRECAAEGYDWEEEQMADAKALGMSIDDYRAALRQKRFAIRGNPSPATTEADDVPINPTPSTDPDDGPGQEDDE